MYLLVVSTWIKNYTKQWMETITIITIIRNEMVFVCVCVCLCAQDEGDFLNENKRKGNFQTVN